MSSRNVSRIPSARAIDKGVDGKSRMNMDSSQRSGATSGTQTPTTFGHKKSRSSLNGSILDALTPPAHIVNTQPQSVSPTKSASSPIRHASSASASAPVTSGIRVAVRMRPLSLREKARGDTEQWHMDEKKNIGVYDGEGKFIPKHSYDVVFGPASTNLEVFKEVAKPLVAPSLEGYSGTVFCYGVTSSGKTHTMLGTETDPGVLPMIISELFGTIASHQQQNRHNATYTVKLSLMEIYNEVINCLLDPSKKNLRVMEEPGSQRLVIEGLKEEEVTSADDALWAVARGENHRKVASTNFNEDSSRSHTICRLIVEVTRLVDPSSALGLGKKGAKAGVVSTSATLSLIDLAGSESAKVTSSKARRDEGGYINKSLLTLGTVINKLASGQHGQHIPFRDSKLTRLLQSSLSGQGARIAIVCNVTPAMAQAEETGNTLKFATRAKLVKIQLGRDEKMDDAALIKSLKAEIKELKRRLTELQDQLLRGAGPDSFKSLRVEVEDDEDGADRASRASSASQMVLRGSGASASRLPRPPPPHSSPSPLSCSSPQIPCLESAIAQTLAEEGPGRGGGSYRSPSGKGHSRLPSLSKSHHDHGLNGLTVHSPPAALSEDAVPKSALVSSQKGLEVEDGDAAALAAILRMQRELREEEEEVSVYHDAETSSVAGSMVHASGNEMVSPSEGNDPWPGQSYRQSRHGSKQDLRIPTQFVRSHSLDIGSRVVSGIETPTDDKDLEVQVLLADRECLQEQIVEIEQQNEQLSSENISLKLELSSIQLEREKGRRMLKELEGEILALRQLNKERDKEKKLMESKGSSKPAADLLSSLVAEVQLLQGMAKSRLGSAASDESIKIKLEELEDKVSSILMDLVQRNAQLEASLAQK